MYLAIGFFLFFLKNFCITFFYSYGFIIFLKKKIMDIYSISFLISTLWIGPFWLAMMINPYSEKTNKLLNKPLFFLGPIIIWFLIMLLNPNGLIDFFNSGSHPDGFFAGLAKGLSTKAGVTAMWAHMVAGDIFATRWIWQDNVERKNNIWLLRLSVFFGIMLMPLGVLIHIIFGRKNKK